MKSVMVTGSAGFIGSTFVRRLLESDGDVRVVSLDALTYAGNPANLEGVAPDRHELIVGDIVDRERVEVLLREREIDTLVHFAAESHVDRSIAGPEAFIRTNVAGTQSLLEAARSAWADRGGQGCRFHQVSTDEVYGDLALDSAPSREGDPYAPSSPYAASKAAGDHLVRAWHRTYGLPVTLSLGSNTYGPRQYPEKLIPVIVRQALRGLPIPIYGDGRQVRDWLHVDDHVEGILAILQRGVAGRSYNLGGDNPCVNLDTATWICVELDRLRPSGAPHAQHLSFVADRPGHDRRYALDISRVRDELGWQPRRPWREGLAATVRWYVDQVTGA